MEVRKSLTGRRLWSAEQKQSILAELGQGFTPAEVARRHEIQLQHLYRWRRRFQEGGEMALRTEVYKLSPNKTRRCAPSKAQIGLEREYIRALGWDVEGRQ